MAALPTREFNALQRRLAVLEQRFLPVSSATGKYTAAEYDGVRAYLVLAHAEIEQHLENFAERLLDRALKQWSLRQRANRVIAALFLYGSRVVDPPSSLGKQPSKDTWATYLKQQAKNHRDYISQKNHGLKEANILAMFMPLGLLDQEFDAVWLADMSSLGSSRGVVAHTSARKVQTPPDPNVTRGAIQRAIAGLQQFEQTATRVTS